MELTERLYELYARILPRGVSFLAERQETERPPEARWATPDETLAPLWRWQKGKLLLGTYNGELIGTGDNRHLVTLAGSRAGKSSTVLLPNLYTYPGSMLVIDPKGELARVTAAHRHDTLKQNVHVLDPFNVAGVRNNLRARFNPLAEIDPLSEDAVDDAAMLADAMILETGGVEGGSHWNMAARNLVRGLILYTLLNPDKSARTLSAMLGKLFKFERASDASEVALSRNALYAGMMVEDDAFDGIVAATAAAMLAKPEKEAASIFSTATEQLAFLDSPGLRHSIAQSDFSIADLARRPTTIYLCLNAGRMATHFRWLRLIVDLAIVQLEREAIKNPVREGSGPPIIFVLEEFATLNHMKRLEVAAGLLAGVGAGIRLWVILQDLGQLKALYKERWQTFLGNAGVVQCFGLNDLESLNYVSERMGETSYWAKSYSAASYQQKLEGHSPASSSLQQARLCTPSELATLVERDSFRQVLVMAGHNPMVMHRLRHETVTKLARGEIA